MTGNLESTLRNKQPSFKSEGERRIAYFLNDNRIKYHYEPGVLVNTDYGKPRIWYPDFYLPEMGTYIEYYGLAGRNNYDRGIKRKEAAYAQMGLAVIPVYPWTFTGNWQAYIMEGLEQIASSRYKNLKSKPYWMRSTPPGYSRGIRKHY